MRQIMRFHPTWPRIWIGAAVLLALSSCSSKSSRTMGSPALVPGALNLAPFASVGSSVTLVTAAPGDTGRVFVVKQNGTIRIVKHGVLRTPPFLDVSSLMSQGSERGLLGMAFAPDYSTSGVFYVSYTDVSGDSQIDRYHVSAANADSADGTTGTHVLNVAQPYANHNGGMIAFGPDGKFYFGLGDGGSEGDPNLTGQDRSDLLGSVLRLDVTNSGTYSVPADNPWVSVSGVRPELWNYGLRNPWRFSFDRQTGDFYIADVGQDNWEEIDAAATTSGRGKGANYGWSVLEGTHCGPNGTCDSTGKTMPVIEYAHNSGAGECCVIGGYVYRGSAIPGLAGLYFYSDYCGEWIRSFRLVSGVATEKKDWGVTLSDNPTTFGEDANGEIYIGTQHGSVYKIVP
jgi:glucose/arabinose dehydrogenase